LLGGVCSCGSTDRLEFDHIDPSTKKFTVGRLMSYSEAAVLEELKKCQLLCFKCHRKKTAEEQRGREPVNKGKWRHGTTTSYMAKKCRCDECRSFYSKYKRGRRATLGWK
jgi:5-methylcytosine-specific restriction endonuclease McrA